MTRLLAEVTVVLFAHIDSGDRVIPIDVGIGQLVSDAGIERERRADAELILYVPCILPTVSVLDRLCRCNGHWDARPIRKSAAPLPVMAPEKTRLPLGR